MDDVDVGIERDDRCDPHSGAATAINSGMRNGAKLKRDLIAEQLWEQCRVLPDC